MSLCGDDFHKFQRIFEKGNPSLDPVMAHKFANTFLHHYGNIIDDISTAVYALWISKEEELITIRHAGRKCVAAICNAKEAAKDMYYGYDEMASKGLQLKDILYSVADDKNKYFTGIDFAMIQMYTQSYIYGINTFLRDCVKFLAYKDLLRYSAWSGIVKKAYAIALKEKYPLVENPISLDVHEYSYECISKNAFFEGVTYNYAKDLCNFFEKKGYSVYLSDRIHDMPYYVLIAINDIKEVKSDE